VRLSNSQRSSRAVRIGLESASPGSSGTCLARLPLGSARTLSRAYIEFNFDRDQLREDAANKGECKAARAEHWVSGGLQALQAGCLFRGRAVVTETAQQW
jgi:hypothetical protein